MIDKNLNEEGDDKKNDNQAMSDDNWNSINSSLYKFISNIDIFMYV